MSVMEGWHSLFFPSSFSSAPAPDIKKLEAIVAPISIFFFLFPSSPRYPSGSMRSPLTSGVILGSGGTSDGAGFLFLPSLSSPPSFLSGLSTTQCGYRQALAANHDYAEGPFESRKCFSSTPFPPLLFLLLPLFFPRFPLPGIIGMAQSLGGKKRLLRRSHTLFEADTPCNLFSLLSSFFLLFFPLTLLFPPRCKWA